MRRSNISIISPLTDLIAEFSACSHFLRKRVRVDSHRGCTYLERYNLLLALDCFAQEVIALLGELLHSCLKFVQSARVKANTNSKRKNALCSEQEGVKGYLL
jgi:hypothetical protein